MIGVDGQYLLSFDIAGRIDFIDEGDLQKFKVVEYSGGRLPEFELGFATRDESLLSVLNEGNILSIYFGESREDINPQDSGEYVILKLKTIPLGDNQRYIEVKGTTNFLKYAKGDTTYISDNVSVFEMITERAAIYFGENNILSNVAKSKDKQRWIQPNISPIRFFQDSILHADLPDSYPLLSVSSDMKFRLLDAKKHYASTDKDWNFSSEPIGTANPDRGIHYQGDYLESQNTGYLNANFGYSRMYELLVADTGEEAEALSETLPYLTQARQLIQQKGISRVLKGFQATSSNTHNRYWEAYLRNLTHLALTSTARVDLSFVGVYKPLRALDLAVFKEKSLTEETVSDYFSGRYIISRVSRVIEDRKITTNVTLCRESINEAKGSFAA